MFSRFTEFEYGYNSMAEMDGTHKDMLMDVGVYKMKASDVVTHNDSDKESAFLLLNGQVTFKWEGQSVTVERHSLFDENPSCLHVPKGVEVVLEASSEAEVLLEKTTNDKVFDSKFYSVDDCQADIFGDNVLGNTSRRVVRTIFDYKNAPYSNLVMGEVINFPGRWSSYPPHGHDQPEIYFYRFDRPTGFGSCFIGEDAFKISHNSIAAIPGPLTHPQTTAPGYAMWYCWMIRHLDNNPWTTRVDDPDHTWVVEPDAKIWPDK